MMLILMSESTTIDDQERMVISRLRKEREKSRLSQLDLALKAGVSQTMVNYIENGERTPTLGTLIKLCNALGISPAVLFEVDDDERAEMKKRLIEIINRYF